MPQARRFVEAVQGNINRKYVHEIVCVVDDLLFAVQKIEYRNKLEGDSPESSELEFIKCKNSMIDKLNSCTPLNPSVLRDIKHTAREAMKKTSEIVMVIDAMAHNLVLLALVNEIATAEYLLRIIEFAKVQSSDD